MFTLSFHFSLGRESVDSLVYSHADARGRPRGSVQSHLTAKVNIFLKTKRNTSIAYKKMRAERLLIVFFFKYKGEEALLDIFLIIELRSQT